MHRAAAVTMTHRLPLPLDSQDVVDVKGSGQVAWASGACP